jgi:hypothetical protein
MYYHYQPTTSGSQKLFPALLGIVHTLFLRLSLRGSATIDLHDVIAKFEHAT